MKNEKKPHQIKQILIEQQLEALQCDKYRITLKPRVPGLHERNYGNLGKDKREAKGIGERFWTARQVIELVRDLEIENMKGYEVYITPLNQDNHYIVVDDGSPKSIKSLIGKGYQPALIQESSLKEDGEINLQAILIAKKGGHRHEQTIANMLVVKLNQEFGDKQFSGVEHPFRLAGFANKKEGKNNFFTNPISMTGIICTKSNEELKKLRDSFALKPKSANANNSQSEKQFENLKSVVEDGSAIKVFNMHLENESKRVIERGGELNQSKLDFRIVKNMMAMGFSNAQIISGLVFASPRIADRHPDVLDYVNRTIDKAR